MADFQRVAHLRAFRLPGGDAAIKEPRRVALAVLWELYGDQVLSWEHLAPVRALDLAERRLLVQMLQKGLNAPITTSAGRLFDGIAGLIGLHQQVTFEGQAAMALEFAVDKEETAAYPLPLLQATETDGRQPAAGSPLLAAPWVLDWSPMVEDILADLQRGLSSGIIAARFHNALVNAIVDVARHAGQERVALTGGCFQNRRLAEHAAQRLRAAGFQVLLHRHVPPNDGGISLGQIAVAAARLSRLP
jgi:hydrogenase maturation protein HypF